ncbi:HNH endonuclease signature motif containing protein [Microbacterium sp. SORGH_AS_0888]|uniref:HNH endonuclease signature motif containing protein n=1 Tax=Microbacterium sp. SORGH_AS_0888 TaxID=3041791 RepID=UPI00277E76E9|nr:HNH endonuclease signature motif containing protein [Microbacterium sp. SORGH_AS_0888]MDQ1130821.1 hypothetical protein [Microbacterium sp. SORGH_AS_0888]
MVSPSTHDTQTTPVADRVPWDDESYPFELDAMLCPEPLDRVQEISTLMGVFLAERAMWIAAMCRDAFAGAGGFGEAAPAVLLRSLRLELAAALRVTEYVAGDLLRRSVALCDHFPEVLTALSTSRITERHADLLIDALEEIEPEHSGRLLEEGLALAERQPVGTFRRALSALSNTLRAATLETRHTEAVAHRLTSIEAAADGMAWFHLYGPHVEVLAIQSRLTAMASSLRAGDDEETRTIDQLRADVACDLLIEGDTRLHPADARGVQATVSVTVPALSLLDEGRAGSAPATVEGIGPIPIARARELCGAAKGWMRVLTHPETGVALSVGRVQYRPPADMARFVKWRAGRCMAPGCHMPASRCQIDHNIAWEHGGSTSVDNLTALCQGHHTLKHHGAWKIRQLEGGVIEWTSPTGRMYLVEPQRRFPTFRDDGVTDDPHPPKVSDALIHAGADATSDPPPF